jgi:cytidylate kinase
MNDYSETVNQMSAVTISREYGSGGGEIASRLARHLGWELIDHEIVERVAAEMGMTTKEAEARDEQAEGVFAKAMNTVQYLDPTFMAYAPSDAFLSDEETYRETLNRVVRAAYTRGHVVIVGRGGQVLLAEQRNVLHVRIIAPLEQRVAYVMQREGLDQEAAESRIRMKEHARGRFLETKYHRKADDAHLYDIVLNTAFLDLDSAVDIIGEALQHKAKRLSVRTGELGPAVGLPRYPGQPEDFRPAEA